MKIRTAILVLFYVMSSVSVRLEERRWSLGAAEIVNGQGDRTDGYTTWDGVQIKHSGVGGGGCGYSGDRLPGMGIRSATSCP